MVLDIDDVIATNAEDFTSWSNKQFGTSLVASDYSEDFRVLWPGVDMAEIQRRATLFHESDAMLSYGHVKEGAVSLRGLTGWYRFVAATSRRRASEEVTRAWLEQSYEGIFEDIIFAGIYDGPTGHGRHLRTKEDIYRKLKPAYVVDDQFKHCLAAANQGINSVLFGDYPWSQGHSLPELMTRCKDWQETKEFFIARKS